VHHYVSSVVTVCCSAKRVDLVAYFARSEAQTSEGSGWGSWSDNQTSPKCAPVGCIASLDRYSSTKHKHKGIKPTQAGVNTLANTYTHQADGKGAYKLKEMKNYWFDFENCNAPFVQSNKIKIKLKKKKIIFFVFFVFYRIFNIFWICIKNFIIKRKFLG